MPDPSTARTEGYNLGEFTERDPRNEDEVVAFVELLANRSYSYFMHSLYRQWYEDLLWYYGEHYLEFNWQTRRFTVKRQHPGIPRTTTNLIYPKCEVGMQLFLESLPAATVKAATREAKDRMAAEVAQHVRKHLWRSSDMTSKRRELAGWVVVTGNGYLLDYLDKATGERVRIPQQESREVPVVDEQGRMIPAEDPSTGEVLLQPDGTPFPLTETQMVDSLDQDGNPVFQELVLADVNTMVASPFEIVPDFSARHPWEMRHFVHHRAQDLGWIKDMFGKPAENLKPETGLGTSAFYQFKVLELIARSQAGGFAGFSHGASVAGAGEYLFMENAAVLKTYFEVPSDKHPKGRIYAVANGKVLHSGTYSELYGEKLCLGMYGWSVLPGSIFRFGMVRNLIDIQRRLNGLDTQRALLRKTMGNPKWLSPLGNNFNALRGLPVPGFVYKYRPRPNQPAPMQLEGKGPPADWERERENQLRDMMDVAGIWYTLSGQNPPGVSAGVSLDLLTEMAGKRFIPMIEENREMARRQELNRLRIAQKAPAWSIPRIVTVIGDDGEMEAKHFTGADFSGEIDVEIEAVTPSMFSQTQKQSHALALLEAGLIDATLESNRDKMRALFNASEFEETMSPDIKRALWENQEMLAGRAPKISPLDNHEAHLQIHSRFLKRTDLERYDPEIIAIFEVHVTETANALAAQLASVASQAARPAEGQRPERGGRRRGRPGRESRR